MGSSRTVIWPSVVIRPTELVALSVNHSAPSGPLAIIAGVDGAAYHWNLPLKRPIVFSAVNHTALSGPSTMPYGEPPTLVVVTMPSGVMRPTPPANVNQPCGVICIGCLPTLNCWTLPSIVTCATLPASASVTQSAPSGLAATPYGPPSSATRMRRTASG